MSKRKRSWALATTAVFSAALLVLSGCSAGEGENPSSQPPKDIDISGTEITMWANGGAQAYREQFNKLIKDFEAETGAKINVTVLPVPYEDQVPARFAAGERPDILEWQPMAGFVAELNPKKNFIDLSGESFQKKIKFHLTDSFGAFDGKKYAAVINFPDLTGIFYNKEVFKKLGLEIPQNKEEWFSTCQEILDSNSGITPLFIGGGDLWPTQIFPFNFWADGIADGLAKDTNTNKTDFNDPRWVQGIQALKDAQDQGCLNKDVLTAKADDEGKALMAGDAAMVAQGSWSIGNWSSVFGDDEVNAKIGFFPLSEKTATASYSGGSEGNIYVVKSGDEKRESASLQFIRYITGKAYAGYVQATGQPSIYEGVDDSADISPLRKVVIAPFLAGKAQPNYEIVLAAFKGSFQDPLAEMLAGRKSAEDVAADLDAQFTKSAKLLGLPGFN